jgi:hypothetical protein
VSAYGGHIPIKIGASRLARGKIYLGVAARFVEPALEVFQQAHISSPKSFYTPNHFS